MCSFFFFITYLFVNICVFVREVLQVRRYSLANLFALVFYIISISMYILRILMQTLFQAECTECDSNASGRDGLF